MASGSKVWSLMGLGATLGATMAARKAITATNYPASKRRIDDVTWAVASGVAVGLARMFATRAAADYYRRSTGHLPANLQDVEV